MDHFDGVVLNDMDTLIVVDEKGALGGETGRVDAVGVVAEVLLGDHFLYYGGNCSSLVRMTFIELKLERIGNHLWE